MKITPEQAEKVRELVDWMKDRSELTRTEAAEAVGMVDGHEFSRAIFWPAKEVLWQAGVAFRSLGGGGRYAVTGWRGMWQRANGTMSTARRKFSRAQGRLPPPQMVPEEKQAALSRARDRLGHADMVIATREEAARQMVTTTDYAGLLGARSGTPRD